MERLTRWVRLSCVGLLCLLLPVGRGWGQEGASASAAAVVRGAGDSSDVGTTVHAMRARRFLAGRTLADGASAASALDAGRREHLAMMKQGSGNREKEAGARDQEKLPRLSPLSAAWTAVGPAQVASQSYGDVTGRVTSVAIDPADASGNTVYLGTTGGGVWKSTNAAGAAASVTFAPLTDTLPVFNANARAVAIPSLSIGAVSVGPVGSGGVVLAGTGDTNDALDSYYGEGILRSADGGVTWTLAQQANDGVAGFHSFVGLGVAGFAWSTATQGLVVAALSQAAEGLVVNAPNTTYSVMGLYYSADAGATWQMATIEDGSQVVQGPAKTGVGGNAATAVVWNAARQRFYAAVRGHGYYESADGMTWTRLAHQPGAGLTTTNCPANPGGTASAACPIFRGVLTVQPTTGDTFALTADANNLDQGLWQDVCAASSAGGGCAGSPIAFGRQLPSTPLEAGGGSTAIAQADYNLALAAVGTGTGATADTLLLVGTVDLYRCSLNAGCALRNTTNATNGCATPAKVAPAQHGLAVLPGAGAGGILPLVYVGNDGGLWRSVDGVNETQAACSVDDATHFQNLNGGLGSLGEVVGMAQDPVAAGTMVVGLGVNGTASSAGANAGGAWAQIAAGEGGAVAIDQANPNNWYVSTAAGVSVRYCGKGAGCAAADFAGTPTIGYAQVNNDASLIAPPMLLDPALGSDVLIGTCRVWRGPAQSGTSWPGQNAVSAVFGGAQNATCDVTNSFVRSMAVGGPASGSVAAQNGGSTVLYAGMAGTLDGGGSVAGHVFANYAAGTASGNAAWTDVAKSPVTNDAADAGEFNRGGFDVSSVVADAHDASGKTVYAMLMGFAGNGTNAPHVYRSVDGGAHWLNISSNLPNAPANALVVDPNDANTAYVAMDTGVYVTSTVTSCATTNCWSVFGVGLPNAPVVALAAGAGLATGDGRSGLLRAGTYGRGMWEIPLVTATGQAAVPAMTLTPVSLTFATQTVGAASAVQTIAITNAGTGALTVSQVTATGDFHETDNCAGVSGGIAAGGSCSVQVTFLPTATGTHAGVLTVYGNVAGGQATATLTGMGSTGSTIVLTPITLSFAGTNIGVTSSPQLVTISNTGGVTATLGTLLVSGDFTITANTCGMTLATNVGCTVGIAFAPTASGARSGTLTVTDSAGIQTVSLSGTGLAAATDALSTLALTFGTQMLNTASATQQITLTNTGDAALALIAAQITNGDFTVVNGCGNSLNGHASCGLLVAFVPKSVGAGIGLMTVTDQFRSQTVVLNGTGVAPPGVSLSPVGTLGFGATGVGLISTAQTVTLTNNGGAALAIQSIVATGDFAIAPGTNTCGATLAVGAACTAQVVFAPTTAGTRTGSVTVMDNAAGSPQSLQLAGTGVDFSLAANGPTSATISAGGQAVYGLLLSSQAGLMGQVTFTCGPLPLHATCVVNPSPGALGGTATISVTVATSVAGAELQWPGARRVVWLATLLPLGLLALRRRVGKVGLLGCLLLAAGCGRGRLIPGENFASQATAIPTPPGSYNLVVAGTSAGLTRSVGLTLLVQ